MVRHRHLSPSMAWPGEWDNKSNITIGSKTITATAWRDERRNNTSKERVKSQRTKRTIKILQKLALLLVCSGVLGYLAYESIRKYSLRETATGDKYQHVNSLPFPQLTLCPSEPYDRAFLEQHGITELNDLR